MQRVIVQDQEIGVREELSPPSAATPPRIFIEKGIRGDPYLFRVRPCARAMSGTRVHGLPPNARVSPARRLPVAGPSCYFWRAAPGAMPVPDPCKGSGPDPKPRFAGPFLRPPEHSTFQRFFHLQARLRHSSGACFRRRETAPLELRGASVEPYPWLGFVRLAPFAPRAGALNQGRSCLNARDRPCSGAGCGHEIQRL